MPPRQDRAEPSLADRLAVRQRPGGWPAGYQDWRRLLFVHWAMPAERLRALVPPVLGLDLFDGDAYVSLVPFVVQAARPVGAPRGVGLTFLETNLRTYVHLDGGEPGVYFFSLDAASAVAVLGARLSLGLPYFLARGWLRGSEYRLRRLGRRRGACHVSYTTGEPVGPAAPGTLDFFLVERYILHSVRGPSVWSVQVHHAPYPLQRAEVTQVAESLTRADGLPSPTGAPLVHYSPGVDVAIFPPRVRLLR